MTDVPNPPTTLNDPAAKVQSAIRRYRTAEVIAPAGAWPRRGFIIEGQRGRLVCAVPPAALGTESLTLGIPEQAPGNLELLCALTPAREETDGAAIDRWSAYHGKPAGVLVILTPLAAKLDGSVVDADEVALVNPLRSFEPRLVRLLNADRARLERAASAILGSEPVEPTAVGVDPAGIDLRTRIGVLRLAATIPVTSEEAATAALSALLARADNPR